MKKNFRKAMAAITVIAIVSVFTMQASALAGLSGYAFDVDGRNNQILQSCHGGWTEDEAGARFICDDGSHLTGWWKIGQSANSATWRFFDESGYLVKGWAGFDAQDNRVWQDAQVVRARLFDPIDGHMLEGYQTVNWYGVNYYYYFAPSGDRNYRNGVLIRNAQTPNGAWANGGGVLQWSSDSQTTGGQGSYPGTWTVPYQDVQQYQTYQAESYPYPSGVTDNGDDTGWLNVDGYCRHYTAGKLDKGLTSIGGYTYYFDKYGNMVTGWQKVGSGYRYFDKTTGIMYFGGWANVGGYSYYFDQNGINLRDTITPDGYYVDKKGKWDGKTRLSDHGPGTVR